MARVQCLYSEYHEPITTGGSRIVIEVGKPGKAVHMNSLSPLECVEEEWEFEVVLGYGMRTSESKTDRQTDKMERGCTLKLSQPPLPLRRCLFIIFLIVLCKEFCVLWKFWLLRDLKTKCWKEHWISPVIPTVFLSYISWLVILFYSFFFSNLTFGNIHCRCDIVEAFLILESDIVWYSSSCFQG